MGMKILCIGDSITAGTGSTPGNSYPDVLKRKFQTEIESVQVINEGIPGASTKDFWQYLNSLRAMDKKSGVKNSELYNNLYDAVIIMLGTNDCREDNWVDTPDSVIYLKKIINFLIDCTGNEPRKIFICSVLPLADKMPLNILGGGHPWKQRKIESEINPALEKLSEEYKLNYIDMYSLFKKADGGINELYDGIHPFDSGYGLIGMAIYQEVRKVFKKEFE